MINRYSLRINEEGQSIRLWDFIHRQWVNPTNNQAHVYVGSATAIVHIERNDTVRISTTRGYPQRIAMAICDTNEVVGTLTISATGICTIRQEERPWNLSQPISPYWRSQLTAVLGFVPGFTITIVDNQDNDVDLMRHRLRNNSLFIPNRYAQGTVAYDANALRMDLHRLINEAIDRQNRDERLRQLEGIVADMNNLEMGHEPNEAAVLAPNDEPAPNEGEPADQIDNINGNAPMPVEPLPPQVAPVENIQANDDVSESESESESEDALQIEMPQMPVNEWDDE